MKHTTFAIPSQLNRQLFSTLYSATDSSRSSDIVILCHGFTGDQQEWGRFPQTALRFNEAGFDALTFDFSGSGKNPREIITLSKQVEDLKSVFHWAQKQGYHKISLVGLSFGGLTTLVANIPDCVTYVFWAPAFYLSKILGFRGFLLRIRGLFQRKPVEINSANNLPIQIDASFVNSLRKVDIDEKLAHFEHSCLLIQGDKDPVVLPKYSRKAFALLPHKEIQQYQEVQGATHDFKDDHLIQFIDLTVAWIESHHHP